MSTLAGRRAIVTGASRGIGRAIAMRLAAEGAEVAVLARNGQQLAELSDDIQAIGGRCVTQTADVTESDPKPSRVAGRGASIDRARTRLRSRSPFREHARNLGSGVAAA